MRYIVYCWKYAAARIGHYHIEPFNQPWTVTCVLQNNEYREGKYITKDISYNQYISLFTDITTSKTHAEGLYIAHFGNMILYRSIFYRKRYNPLILREECRKSKAKMLVVEYTHPDMENSIFFDLDDFIYVEKNTLFSPLFVRRYLEHQGEEYVFDDKYVLRLMDNDVSSFELKSNQYLLMNENNYIVSEI
jgi:hypothetical protein